MRITALLVPADEDTPISKAQIAPYDVEAIERILKGSFTYFLIERPAAALVLNENGVYMDLAFNKCATRLLWCHASQYRGHYFLVGPVLVTGPLDDDGQPASVPDELLNLLLHTEIYRIEVQADDGGGWYGNEQRFAKWEDAYDVALSIALRWTAVMHVRVVPA